MDADPSLSLTPSRRRQDQNVECRVKLGRHGFVVLRLPPTEQQTGQALSCGEGQPQSPPRLLV